MPFLRSFGVPELLIIMFIILIIFGAGKLPQIGGALGKGIREFRKGTGGEPSSPSGKRRGQKSKKA